MHSMIGMIMIYITRCNKKQGTAGLEKCAKDIPITIYGMEVDSQQQNTLIIEL